MRYTGLFGHGYSRFTQVYLLILEGDAVLVLKRFLVDTHFDGET